MKRIAFAGFLCMALLNPARAGTLAADPASGQAGLVSGYGGLTLGWEFLVTAPEGITVDGLGFWDHQFDGFYLSQTFPVGLWDTTGSLLRSTTVTSGSALKASLHPSGGWRVNAVSPLFLPQGLYRIGALMPVEGANQIVVFDATVQSAPEITVTRHMRQIGSPTLALPEWPMNDASDVNFGPTFTFTTGPTAPTGTAVVPKSFTAVDGNSGMNTLVRGSGYPRAYQMQFSAAALSGLPVGAILTELRFRLNDTAGAPFPSEAVNWSFYDVMLAQAVNSVAQMNSDFTSNMRSTVLVKHGGLSLSPYSFSAGASPNTFASFIVFDTPYVYRGGDLVMLFRHPGSSSANTEYLDAVSSTTSGYGTDFKALSANSATANTGVAASVNVVQIVFTYSPVGSILGQGSNVIVAGAGGPPGGAYELLSSTELFAPVSQWITVKNDHFDSNGAFRYTNTIEARARFFRIGIR